MSRKNKTNSQRRGNPSRRKSGAAFLSIWRPQEPGGPPATVHVVAGKKNVSKRAVDRNRVKRRLKAALRNCFGTDLEQLAAAAKPETVWILSCNRSLLTAEWDAVLREVRGHGCEVFGLAE